VTTTSTPESQPPQINTFVCAGCGTEYGDISQLNEFGKCDICVSMERRNAKITEDLELTKLKKYIFDNGFTESAVAMHIALLCSQPLVIPSTPGWDYHTPADIPKSVFTLLKTPGYLEGIWPSLRIIMGSNKSNEAWTASIATTVALFDVIRTLPVL
jgi:hypothetical protein